MDLPWQPENLLAQLAKPEPDGLIAAAGGYILLVRLNDFSRELAVGLEAPRGDQPREEKVTLGFSVSSDETTKANMGSVADLRASLARASLASDSRAFPNELLTASCYMVLLAERAVRSKSNKLSLGRASSNDIVLRHASVSKVHAYLSLGPPLVLTDSGSLNHTFVNGDPVGQSQRLGDGDVIKLGAVQCVLMSPASLWAAVRKRG